LPVGS